MKILATTALALLMSASALYAQEEPMKSKPASEYAEWTAQQGKLKAELSATQGQVKAKLDKVEAKLAAAGEEAKPELEAARTELKQTLADIDQSLNSVGTATNTTWAEVSKAATDVNDKAKATLDRHKDDGAGAKTPEQNTDMK